MSRVKEGHRQKGRTPDGTADPRAMVRVGETGQQV